VTTALTPGTATVLDARLTSSNGTEITGVEGSPTTVTIVTPPLPPLAPTLLGTFTDANPTAPIADFTATIDWGGPGTGSTTGTVTQPGGTGTPFLVSGSFTYSEEGIYAVTVTVDDVGGQSTTISDSAIIADAALAYPTQTPISQDEPTIFPVPVFAPPAFTPADGPVATFTDANPAAPVSDFTAMIDWGDGTPESAGTVTQPAGIPGTPFDVSGSHTYADAGTTGTYNIQVFVTDVGGSKLTIPNVAIVIDNPISVRGQLNPASDSGKYDYDDITNVRQPDFYGTVLATLPSGATTPEGYADVSLYATNLATGVVTPIGAVQAGSHGGWNIRSTVALADGNYAITATAVDQFGLTTSATAVITPDLLIDTVGPRITAADFNRLTDTATFIFQDLQQNGVTPGGSALLVQSLSDAANYSLNRVSPKPPGTFIVTSISVTPDPTIPYAYDVAVVFNNGAPIIKGGYFQVIARAESVLLPSGIQDLAGNALDGEFYGPQSASGNGVPGGNFIANFEDIHHGTLGHGYSGPVTIIGTPQPNDPPPAHIVTTKTPKVTKLAAVRVVAPHKPKLTAKAVAAARTKR
ncbi:MAG TPA: Ig-like domain-containing protein, partial [Isosphaeraceae bacterium]|nr:Ig-like domain-containing protein [Isosphaeraceae bacterium]